MEPKEVLSVEPLSNSTIIRTVEHFSVTYRLIATSETHVGVVWRQTNLCIYFFLKMTIPFIKVKIEFSTNMKLIKHCINLVHTRLIYRYS